jgi:hypothetical protein
MGVGPMENLENGARQSAKSYIKICHGSDRQPLRGVPLGTARPFSEWLSQKSKNKLAGFLNRLSLHNLCCLDGFVAVLHAGYGTRDDEKGYDDHWRAPLVSWSSPMIRPPRYPRYGEGVFVSRGYSVFRSSSPSCRKRHPG